jgi:FtsH-binding integral membrane protein
MSDNSRLRRARKVLTIHPLLCGIYPALTLYIHNSSRLQVMEAIPTMLFVTGTVLTLWLAVNIIVRQPSKSAFIVTTFILLFFSYGHILSGLSVFGYAVGILDQNTALILLGEKGAVLVLILLLIAFAGISYYILRARSKFENLTQVLNVVSVGLIVSAVATGWFQSVGSPREEPDHELAIEQTGALTGISSSELQDLLPKTSPPPGQLPDIYYIVVDGYGRDDILQQLYGLEDSDLHSFLLETGFYIAEGSLANYSQTALSLASSLNMTYLDSLAEQIGTRSCNVNPLTPYIKANRVLEYLRRCGYDIIAFSSGFPSTEMTAADIYMAPDWSLNTFQNELINTTPLALLRDTQYDLHRHRIQFVLDHLADPFQTSNPAFVFAHILAPHPPFVFGPNGEETHPDQKFTLFDGSDFTEIAGQEAYIAGYRDQLSYIEDQLQIVLEQLLSRSGDPPVIILQADHGPGSRLDWESIETTYLPERMSILNAYYFPDGDYHDLYPQITPVNSFRVLFNHYFGTDLDLLEDASYFSTLARPFLFVDVTQDVLVPGIETNRQGVHE